MNLKVLAEAPTRVDLAGGTLDLWPIAQLLSEKATVNLAISLNATVEISVLSSKEFYVESLDQNIKISGSFSEIIAKQELKLFSLILQNLWAKDYPGLKISARALSPAGAGLGGSSSLAITFIAAIFRLQKELGIIAETPPEYFLVRTAQDIEAKIIHAPTGVQDYWGAVRGGLNILTFPPGGEKIETLPGNSFSTLARQMIVCYSGQSRASAINNWEIFKKVFDHDNKLIEVLGDLGKAAFGCAESIRSGDFKKALDYSKIEWNQRVKLWPGIETVKTKALDRAGQDSGAWFSRVCGAGGGGVMIFFAPEEKLLTVKKALTIAGGIILDCTIGSSGLKVSVES